MRRHPETAFDFGQDRRDHHDKGKSMHTQRCLASATVLIAITAAVGSAQSITSAHSGILHYFDGSVKIDGAPVESKTGKFSEIKENSVLSTGQGRAEMLLTPGVFLRIGENSSVKMLDNRLMSTRVEFLSGSAIVESDDPEVSVKDPAVTIVYKTYQIQPVKYGLFEITSDPGQMKVYKGQASVTAADQHTVVKDGRLLPFSAALLTEKFDEKQADDLYLWTRDRSSALSAANMSSARSLASSGYRMGSSYPGFGFSPLFQGGWYLNSALGMYTYMPYGGLLYSPFGYGFYSPGLIDSYYSPYPYYWYGGGGSRAGNAAGQPLANLSAFSGRSTGVTASQVSRLGAAHPTLSSPLRGSTAAGGFSRGGGFAGNGMSEGGFGGGGFGSRGAGLSGSAPASSGGGSFSGGGASGGGGFSAASAGGGGGGGRTGGGGGGGGGGARGGR
jgi:hypothetical protein